MSKNKGDVSIVKELYRDGSVVKELGDGSIVKELGRCFHCQRMRKMVPWCRASDWKTRVLATEVLAKLMAVITLIKTIES